MMATSCSGQCSTTMMIKNYKIDTPIEFLLSSHKPSKSQKSVLSLFLSKNWYSQCPHMPKRAPFYNHKETPTEKRKNEQLLIFSCAPGLGAAALSFYDTGKILYTSSIVAPSHELRKILRFLVSWLQHWECGKYLKKKRFIINTASRSSKATALTFYPKLLKCIDQALLFNNIE